MMLVHVKSCFLVLKCYFSGSRFNLFTSISLIGCFLKLADLDKRFVLFVLSKAPIFVSSTLGSHFIIT